MTLRLKFCQKEYRKEWRNCWKETQTPKILLALEENAKSSRKEIGNCKKGERMKDKKVAGV
jgi:hypothetical protein